MAAIVVSLVSVVVGLAGVVAGAVIGSESASHTTKQQTNSNATIASAQVLFQGRNAAYAKIVEDQRIISGNGFGVSLDIGQHAFKSAKANIRAELARMEAADVKYQADSTAASLIESDETLALDHRCVDAASDLVNEVSIIANTYFRPSSTSVPADDWDYLYKALTPYNRAFNAAQQAFFKSARKDLTAGQSGLS